MKKFLFLTFTVFFAAFFFSCAAFVEKTPCSRNIADFGIKNEKELVRFFRSHNKSIPKKKIRRLAVLYIEESADEGINSDVAFVQMCLETGFLCYGNLVVPEMNNFCGLGAMDAEHPGEWFDSEETGVRAHIQHLQAYATPVEVELKKELVDPRYGWVHKAKSAQTVFELAGQWATDPDYGKKLDRLLAELEGF